jgi:hypothetical protein
LVFVFERDGIEQDRTE